MIISGPWWPRPRPSATRLASRRSARDRCVPNWPCGLLSRPISQARPWSWSGHTASLQWAPQGKATVLDVRPTESPSTCLPRSGLSSAHVSSRTRAFNRNKSPHVSRLRGRRSQRRGEVGSWDVSVVDAHPDRSSPKWPRAGRSLLFSKETRGVWTVRGTQNMTAIDNRFPKLGHCWAPVDRWPSKPGVAGFESCRARHFPREFADCAHCLGTGGEGTGEKSDRLGPKIG